MSRGDVTQAAIDALLASSKQNLAYLVAGLAVILLFAIRYGGSKHDVAVPTIGPSGRLTSYYGAMKFLWDARAMLEEGYIKFQLHTFKAPMFGKWLVVVSDPGLIEEVRKAPDDILVQAANDEAVSAKYTLGQRVNANSYHINLIAIHLTRNIATMYNDMQDEIAQAFVDNFPLEGTEWRTFSITEPIMQIACRSTNRIFVGLPLCRNKDYLNLNIRLTVDVVKAAYILSLFPESLKGIASQFLTSVPSCTNRGLKHLSPVIEERMRQLKEHNGDWPERPNDMLSWLMDEAHNHGEEGDAVVLTQRILTLNFAAIHTTSMTFIHALLHLVSRPEYIRPLREEAENIIYSEGWSKASLQKMRMLDSFLKETMRFSSLLMLPMLRKVLVDYTLSDGTFLSAGTTISCNIVTAHFHNARYSDPYTFDGNRFLEETESAKHQMSGVSADFLSFGYGRHACPGRLFAASEIKTMMAYLLIHYDVKLEDGVTARPKDFEFGSAVVPNLKARVMFRKRQV